MEVEFCAEARAELRRLPRDEYLAMLKAVEKLVQHGDSLDFPHTSSVRGASNLRELRPRSGRSPWRAFYRRIGATIYVGAFGPEALANPKGFRGAVADAEMRLDAIEKGNR